MEHEELLYTIGHNIKIQRAIRKLTQANLAEIIDVHEKYIGIIESGKQNLTIKTLNKIANALKVDISVLLKKIDV